MITKIKQQLTRFRNDKRGGAWQWTVFLLSFILTAVIYYPMNAAWEAVSTLILAGYTFTGTTAYAITFVQLVITYLCIFGLFYLIVWLWVNSKADPYGGLA
jgi:hypothetical protein